MGNAIKIIGVIFAGFTAWGLWWKGGRKVIGWVREWRGGRNPAPPNPAHPRPAPPSWSGSIRWSRWRRAGGRREGRGEGDNAIKVIGLIFTGFTAWGLWWKGGKKVVLWIREWRKKEEPRPTPAGPSEGRSSSVERLDQMERGEGSGEGGNAIKLLASFSADSRPRAFHGKNAIKIIGLIFTGFTAWGLGWKGARKVVGWIRAWRERGDSTRSSQTGSIELERVNRMERGEGKGGRGRGGGWKRVERVGEGGRWTWIRYMWWGGLRRKKRSISLTRFGYELSLGRDGLLYFYFI